MEQYVVFTLFVFLSVVLLGVVYAFDRESLSTNGSP